MPAFGDLAALPADRAVSQYVRRAWTVEQGLPHGTVRGFAQTADGYLWLATYEGLVRFNGVVWQVTAGEWKDARLHGAAALRVVHVLHAMPTDSGGSDLIVASVPGSAPAGCVMLQVSLTGRTRLAVVELNEWCLVQRADLALVRRRLERGVRGG